MIAAPDGGCPDAEATDNDDSNSNGDSSGDTGDNGDGGSGRRLGELPPRNSEEAKR